MGMKKWARTRGRGRRSKRPFVRSVALRQRCRTSAYTCRRRGYLIRVSVLWSDQGLPRCGCGGRFFLKGC